MRACRPLSPFAMCPLVLIVHKHIHIYSAHCQIRQIVSTIVVHDRDEISSSCL
jgi:hypothetical protein